MADSIYSIPNWATATAYVRNDVVLDNGRYYYCITPHTSSGARSGDDSKWGGVKLDNRGQYKPNFIWQGSYNQAMDFSPRIKKIQFGDGYEQRLQDGINNNLIQIDLLFDNRDYKETLAISHFLYARNGTESFLYTPPFPFNAEKLFTCENHKSTLIFYNNYRIEARFTEKVN